MVEVNKLVKFHTSQGIKGGTVLGTTSEGKLAIKDLDDQQWAVSQDKVEVIPFQRKTPPSEMMIKRLRKELELLNTKSESKEADAANGAAIDAVHEKDVLIHQLTEENQKIKAKLRNYEKVLKAYGEIITIKLISPGDSIDSVAELVKLVNELVTE